MTETWYCQKCGRAESDTTMKYMLPGPSCICGEPFQSYRATRKPPTFEQQLKTLGREAKAKKKREKRKKSGLRLIRGGKS